MKVIFLDFDGVINNWDVYDGVDVNNVRILKQIIDWKTLHITHKAVVHYPLCESSGYVKPTKAGKPPQIKSVSLFLRRFQEYYSLNDQY